MKKITLTTLTLGLMIFSFISTASAFGPRHSDDIERGQCWEELGLNLEQEKKIDQIRSDFREENRDTIAALKTARSELHGLMRANDPDTDAIKRANAKVNSLKESLMLARLEMHKDIKNILTPEQAKTMEGLRDERGYGHHGKGDRPCRS